MTCIRRPAGAVLAATLLAAALPVAAQRGPAAVPTRLPADVLGLACAPQAAYEEPPTPLRITGGQDSFVRRNHAPGDLVTINAGSMNGIEVGQEFFVRRLQKTGLGGVTRETPGVIRTSGWIKVYAVDDEWSLATITHACDTITIDDYLEPLKLPTVPLAATERPKPERDNYARVMAGTDGRRSFGKGDYLIVDRGSEEGVTPGALFVFYRDKRQPENFLYELGEATAVDVKSDTATLFVTLSRDTIQQGDYVAQRKPPAP
jgi:hypothetical protein